MKVIREVLTALTTDDGNVVRVNSKEHTPMSDSRFKLIVGSFTKVGLAHAAVKIFSNFDTDAAVFMALISIVVFAILYLTSVAIKWS